MDYEKVIKDYVKSSDKISIKDISKVIGLTESSTIKIVDKILQEGRYSKSILPMGVLNLNTGDSKYFNVLTEWKKDKTTAEIWKTNDGKLKIIFTSGTEPIGELTTIDSFVHDQTRRPLFTGMMIDYALLEDLKDLADKYGSKISCYTYK